MKTIEPPASLAASATDFEKEIFKVDVSEYVNKYNSLIENLELVFTLILGQCTKITRIHLEGLPTWEAMGDRSDVIKLLKMVKSISHQIMSQMYHPLSLYFAKRGVYRLQQGPHTTNAQLVKRLKSRVEVIKEIGRAIGTNSKLLEYKLTNYIKEIVVYPADTLPAHIVEEKRCAQERYLAVILICAVERGRADRQLLQELSNNSLKGQ